jgi:hypothetical protein
MGSRLSNSRLQIFIECQRCFWLLNVCKTCKGPRASNCKRNKHDVWDRPKTIVAQITNGIDKQLKEHYNNFRANNTLPTELHDKPEFANLSLFPDAKLVDDYAKAQDYNVGLIYDDASLDSRLNGGLDELFITNDDKCVPVDFKTSYGTKDRDKRYEDDIEYGYQIQLSIYAFLLQKLGHEIESYGLLLHYYPKNIQENGNFEFGLDIIKMPVKVKDAYDLWKDGATLLKSSCPPDNGDCDWCKGRP